MAQAPAAKRTEKLTCPAAARRDYGTATRPEAFSDGRGGDCEDSSPVTCAVGILATPDRTLFHAVAVIRVPKPPAGPDWVPVGVKSPVDIYDAVM